MLRVPCVPRTFDESFEPFSLEVDRLADHAQAPPPFMQLVVVGADTPLLCHGKIFDSRAREPHPQRSEIHAAKPRMPPGGDTAFTDLDRF